MAPERRTLGWAALLMILELPFSVVRPLIARHLFDVAIPASDLSLAIRLAGLIALLSVANQLVSGGQSVLLGKFHARVSHRVRRDIFRHFQRLPLGWFTDKDTGYLMSRQTDDVDNLDGILADTFIRAAMDGIRAVVVVILLVLLEPYLAVTGFAFVFVIFTTNYFFSRPLRNASTATRETWSLTSAALHDSLSGHALIRASAAEASARLLFAGKLADHLRARFRRDMLAVAAGRLSGVISGIGMGLILLVGSWRILSGDFTLGGLFAFFLYLANLFGATHSLAALNPTIQRALASAERITELLDTEPSIQNSESPQRHSIRGEVEFEAVDFAYRPDRPVIRGASIQVPTGAAVALVGPSGAGKTTFVNLIPRFYDVGRGAVRIDGLDVREFDLHMLRRQIGVVPQEVFLFNRSVRENLAMGRVGVSSDPEALVAAARAANAHDFIQALPDGYNTLIGDRGIKLSGGEKQRIAIAREIVRNPRILVLDEATSSLDTVSESLVQEALHRLRQGRTSFTIAHRLSTILSADLILVFQAGVIIAQGSHSSLLDSCPLYRTLYETQFVNPAENPRRGPLSKANAAQPQTPSTPDERKT